MQLGTNYWLQAEDPMNTLAQNEHIKIGIWNPILKSQSQSTIIDATWMPSYMITHSLRFNGAHKELMHGRLIQQTTITNVTVCTLWILTSIESQRDCPCTKFTPPLSGTTMVSHYIDNRRSPPWKSPQLPSKRARITTYLQALT